MSEPRAEDGRTGPLLKSVDAWWTVLFVDPIAIRLVEWARPKRWITPTRITAMAHLLGIVSAGLVLAGHLVPAALVFEIRFLGDCVDGKLARARGTTSAGGAFFDLMGDAIVVGANVVAVVVWLDWNSQIPSPFVAVLPAAYLGIVAAGQAARRQATESERPLPVFSDRTPGGYRGWMARHRLRPLPSRIDVEQVLLAVLPAATGITGETVWLEAGVVAATAYLLAETVHISVLGWRVARAQDLAQAQDLANP